MFARLIGSAPGHQQSVGSTSTSLLLHATLIGLAIQFSSRVATPFGDPVVPQHVVYTQPLTPVHVPAGPRLVSHCDRCGAPILPVIDIHLDVPDHIPGTIPDPGPALSIGQGTVTPAQGQVVCVDCSSWPAPVGEEAARPLPGNPQPAYPALLRSAHVEGKIAAHFVVDSTGRVDAHSINFDSGGEPLFESAVRRALLASRYEPARAGGRPVAMRVEQEFAFRITP